MLLAPLLGAATFLALASAPAGLARPLQSEQQLALFSSGVEVQSDKPIIAYGASHLSEWCAESKANFLQDLKNDDAGDWILVMGNEAADLDSLVSSVALAYDVSHTKHRPAKAIAVLQIATSSIDLRPENKLALEEARMESGHRDLLTLEELPMLPEDVGKRIKGIMLVDHNQPLSWWGDVPVLGIVDHHSDRGVNLTAVPRLIEPSGSCSSLITSLILDHKHTHGPLPRSLGDLILSTIAIDTKGLKKGRLVDHVAAQNIFPHSHYSEEDFVETMKTLGKKLRAAKKDIGHLNVTELIQRDWKGDIVFDSTIPIHLGFASIPVSFQDLINRTPDKTTESFFEIDTAWASRNHVDIAVMLTSFKDDEDAKHREIILTVRSGHRIDEVEAERLFVDVKKDIEASDELVLHPWNAGQELGKWRYAWTHNREDGGRKVVRPLVEKAVRHW